MTIEIPSRLNLIILESLYQQLELESQGATVDLLVPMTIESSDFGIIPATIQFAATWVRNPNSGKLLVNIKNNHDEILSFMGEDFAFPIVIMSWRKGIFLADKLTEIKAELKPINAKIQFEMRSLGNVRGNKLLLTCFDHLAENKGLLDCFYLDNQFIKAEDYLSFSLAPILLNKLAFNREATKRNLTPISDDLIGIIYELMKNTDEWARTDKNNKPFNSNVRGMFARFVKKRKESFIENYAYHNGFSNYFQSLPVTELGEQYFVEISVFDSGSGFVDKFPSVKQASSIYEKVDVVKNCLIRHKTAAVGMNKYGKGQGLDRMLKILDNKGFLWIRTDSVSIYRNLIKNPYSESTGESGIDMYDWNTHLPDRFSENAKVSGSSLTIFYPIL